MQMVLRYANYVNYDVVDFCCTVSHFGLWSTSGYIW